jgi:hypothetical protein
MTPALHRAARVSRVWLLWFGMVLLASHSLATWHPYSHSIDEVAGQRDARHQVDLSDCGLCLSGIANLGGAPPIVPAPLAPRLDSQPPLPMRMAAVWPAPARQPYAIRAPPVIAG